jgi:hypothetical protein
VIFIPDGSFHSVNHPEEKGLRNIQPKADGLAQQRQKNCGPESRAACSLMPAWGLPAEEPSVRGRLLKPRLLRVAFIQQGGLFETIVSSLGQKILHSEDETQST